MIVCWKILLKIIYLLNIYSRQNYFLGNFEKASFKFVRRETQITVFFRLCVAWFMWHTRTCTHVHTRAYTHTHTYKHTHTQTIKHTNTHTITQTHTQSHKHTHNHTKDESCGLAVEYSAHNQKVMDSIPVQC